MAKAPAFQFYVKDWMADLAEHPLEIEGAWCRFCAKAWLSETPGELWYTLDQWARLWRVDGEDALRIWRYIVEEKIGDSDTDLTELSCDSHAKIHLACRRMVREEKDKEGDRIRQRRRYEKKKCEPMTHADSHACSHEKLTSPSSSASATAKKEEIKKPPYPPSGGEVAGPSLPMSPEENPDNLPGAEISDLSECLIEFQDIAAVFQEAGGNVDIVPAYNAFRSMRYNFPKDRVVDDIAARGQSDAWRRMDVPMNLSTYLSKKKWLDPIPKPRERTRASPQVRTFRDQRQMESEQTAKRLKAAMGISNASVDAATGQVSHGFVQHAALGGGAEKS